MLRNSNLGPLLVILTFLLVVVGGVAIRERRWPGLPWSFGVAPTNFELVTKATSGGVVSGFPRGFVEIAKDTAVSSSAQYVFTKDEDKFSVLTATYSTGASISDLFAAYIEYLNEHGYTVIKTDSSSGVSNIEGLNKKQTVSISIYVLNKDKKEVRVDIKSAVLQ